MDADLAFCLNHFIDDQVQIIDDRIEGIKGKEEVDCKQFKEEQEVANRNKPVEKDKGSHDNDETLVKQFVQDLRDSRDRPSKTRTIVDDPSCVESLRAELLVKVGACRTYLVRLQTLAKPLPNTSKFVQSCNEAIEYFHRTREFDENFKTLYTRLEQTESADVIPTIHNWWKDSYGSTIADLNRRNQKINGVANDNSVSLISPTSRVITHAKKLVDTRQIIPIEPAHYDLIRKFVRRHLSMDEAKREETNPDELIEDLQKRDIDQIADYAERWLSSRDAVRNHKEEDPYEAKIENAKAEGGRKRIAQEAKKLALAALLCRLAIGSENSGQFSQQLKKTLNKHKKSHPQDLPVVSGEIKDAEAEELPLMFQLNMNKDDIDRWNANSDGLQQRFAASLCKAFGIPSEQICVKGFDQQNGIVILYVVPPYGKRVVECLNGGVADAAARMEAVRKCCLDAGANVESITLGEFGLSVRDKLMDPMHNKKYGWPNQCAPGEENWADPIDRGGKPYHCPSGWKRFGIKVAEDGPEFDAQWGSWYIAYHGTQGENASNILTSGLKVSTTGCFYGDGVARVYVSPSIEYCAHPRYARPWTQTTKNGQTFWYQLVFQCRVNPASVASVGPETLIHQQYKQIVTIDPNFGNHELEWIILGKKNQEFIKDDIICYGLMLRTSSVDPASLTPSSWWKKSHHADSYK